MDSSRYRRVKRELDEKPHLAEKYTVDDADEDASPRRNWSTILVFAVVPLLVLVAFVLGGFALISTAFGAETQLLANEAHTSSYRF